MPALKSTRPSAGRFSHPFVIVAGPFRPRRRFTLPHGRALGRILLTVSIGLLAALGAIVVVTTLWRLL